MAHYDVDLRDYWRILRKRKTIVILMIFLVGGFSYVFAKLREPIPVYKAHAAVKIERRSNLADFFMKGFWNQGDNITTQAFIIKSFPVMEKTAKFLGWLPADVPSDEIRNSKMFLSVIKRLQGMIMAEQQSGTNILNIRAISEDPRETADVANAVAITYRNYNIQEKNKQTFETKAFIEEQLKLTEQQLSQAEEKLKTFKKKYNLIALDEQTINTLNRLFSIESEYDSIKKEKDIVASQLRQLEKTKGSPENLDGVFLHDTENPSLAELNKRLRDLVMKRKTLLFDFTEEHPQVVEINDQIHGMLYGVRKELSSRLAGLGAMESDLLKKLNLLKKESRELPDRSLHLSRLQREVVLQESLYSQLKIKYQEILIQAAGRVEEVLIIHPAIIPTRAINIPSKITVTASGIVMGIFMGIFFAFVAETMDTSIGTIEDVEKLLSIPVIGVIPHLKKEEKEKKGFSDRGRIGDLITHFEPNSLVSEAFRSIRTNLQFMALEIKGKSFLITSSFIQEGKTFNAANIALSIAQAGKRVLLVDADLRNPSAHKVFGLDQDPGLRDYVMGNYPLSEIINTVTDLMIGDLDIEDIMINPGLDNLNYVTSGTASPNPSEILRSERLREFMKTVCQDYDIILVDAPPVLPVADALDVAPFVDGVILVYTVGKIGRNVLKRAKSALDNVNVRVMGVILNNVKPDTGPDYFKYQSQYYYRPGNEPDRSTWGKIGKKPGSLAGRGKLARYVLVLMGVVILSVVIILILKYNYDLRSIVKSLFSL